VARAHPYVIGAGAALALSVGIGAGVKIYKRGSIRMNLNGVTENGMLKEAIGKYCSLLIQPLLYR